jgi:signal transduction histidine kinase
LTAQSSRETFLSVQDAGIGLAPEEMARLFDAFYTTKATHGIGMGLAISRSIMSAHGGRLWAEPNDGPGATFVLSLPNADYVASRRAEGDSPAALTSSGLPRQRSPRR